MKVLDNQDIGVVHQILDLAQTVRQGLDYLRVKLRTTDCSENNGMLLDVVAGITSMEKALTQITDKLTDSKQIEEYTQQIRSDLEALVEDFLREDRVAAQQQLQSKVLSTYQLWQNELESRLREVIQT